MAQFFQTQKAKRFRYEPRYYNEMAEKRKEREARIIKEIEAEEKGYSKGTSVEQMANYIKLSRKAKKKSNIRILVILMFLLAIVYFFFL